MKVLLRVVTLSLCALSLLHAHASRQTIPNFHYMRGVSKTDFTTSGGTTLIETFTINNPGTYTLVQDIGYQGRSNATGHGGACAIFVNSSNVVIDLGGFTLYNNSGATLTSLQSGIVVQKAKHNVSIKNGNIAGFQDTGIFVIRECNNVRIKDITISNCAKNGIFFAGANNTAVTDALQISNCTIDNVTVAQTTGVTNVNDAVGLKMFHCYNILVKDSSFGYANAGILAAPKDSYGVLVSSGTAIVFKDCEANGNYGNNAYGFKLSGTTETSSSTSCSFVNCTANGNEAIIPNTAYDSTKGVCYAFSGSSVRACTWDKCTANGNQATQTAHGFFYSDTEFCETINCTVLNSRAGNSGLSNLHGARGFYSISGTGNVWNNCIARGQQIPEQAPSATMAIGFELDAENYSLIQNCTSSYNGDENSNSWGIGIHLRDTTSNSPCTSCTIDNCKVTTNKSNTAGQGAGILDANISSSTLITNCFAFNNGKDATMKNYSVTYASGPGLDTNAGTVNSMGTSFTAPIAPYVNIDVTSV